MFKIGDAVKDTRYNRVGIVQLIEPKKNGDLHKVLFANGKWGSYYRETMERRFESTEKPAMLKPQDSNVVYYDFVNKTEFADRKSWEQWLGKAS